MASHGIHKRMKCGQLDGLLKFCLLFLLFIGDFKKRWEDQHGVNAKITGTGYDSKDSRQKFWLVMAKLQRHIILQRKT